MRKRVLIEGGVVWNSIWSHGHEVAKALAKKYDVFYVEPVRTKANHAHLKEKSNFTVPKHIKVVQHARILQDLNFEYLTYSERDNERIIRQINPHILITYQCLLGMKAFRYAKKNGIKTIYMLVDEFAALSHNAIVKAYLGLAEPYMMRKSDGVLCTAKVLQQRAARHNKNAVYIPNGVNTETLKERIGKLREVKNKKVTIGFVGVLGSWIDISWFTTVAKEHPKAQVCVIGAGDQFEKLKAQKERLKLANLELCGFLPHGEAMRKMASFDIVLVPFHVNKITHAVSPIKLFEYWSMGKPVVAARTMELEQFKGELIFATANDVSRKISPLIANAKLRSTLGSKGKQRVAQFDWEILGKQVRHFVQQVSQ
jgi:glycosyltransferase involved in cell wall biosynthesis